MAEPALTDQAKEAGLTQQMVQKLSPDQLYSLLKSHHHSEMDVSEGPVAVVVPVACFVMVLGIVAVVLYAGFRKERQKQETVRAFLEKGVPVPSELLTPVVRRSDLRRGIVLIATGIGLSVFLGLASGEREAASLGALPAIMGLGYLVVWKLEKSKQS